MEQLVLLHGCQNRDGRAASAPLARTGASNKATMASQGVDLGAVAGTAATPLGANPVISGSSGDASSAGYGSGSVGPVRLDGSGPPIMPHLSLEPSELDAQYPSMRAPADDRTEDFIKDHDDLIFQNGMQIADEIRAAMRSEGRTSSRTRS